MLLCLPRKGNRRVVFIGAGKLQFAEPAYGEYQFAVFKPSGLSPPYLEDRECADVPPRTDESVPLAAEHRLELPQAAELHRTNNCETILRV